MANWSKRIRDSMPTVIQRGKSGAQSSMGSQEEAHSDSGATSSSQKPGPSKKRRTRQNSPRSRSCSSRRSRSDGWGDMTEDW